MSDIAKRDQNYIPAIQAVSNVDGRSPVDLWADPSTHALIVEASVSLDTTGLATEAKQNDGISKLTDIVTNTTTLAGAVSGTEVQVDILTMPDINAITNALPAGTNTIGAVEMDGTALANGQVNVDTTAGGVTILAASAGRQGVLIKNQGSVTCYIGISGVTTSTGIELKAGESLSLPTDSAVHGITASSSTTVGYVAFA